MNKQGWCFKDIEGKLVKGWHSDGQHWYYFDKNSSVMQEGWKFEDGNWYYLNSSGQMITGWLQEGDTWYYLNTDGSMAKGWTKIKDKWYYFKDNGTMLTGWYQQEKCVWYYFNKDNGDLLTGWQYIDGYWYFFNVDGKMLYNQWYSDGTNWFRLDTSGAMIKGWYSDGSYWYYLDDNGHMVIGQQEIDGKTYNFNEKGQMTGEVTNSGFVSDKLVEFVKSYEGFYSKPYRGADYQNLTLGYGTTNHCSASWLFDYVPVSKELATRALKEEINLMAKKLKADLDSKGVSLKQNEFDALCSFSYNCGLGGLLSSTLYKRICEGVRDSSLKDNFTAWSKCNGQTLQGLLNRRIEEYEMFMNGDYIRNL